MFPGPSSAAPPPFRALTGTAPLKQPGIVDAERPREAFRALTGTAPLKREYDPSKNENAIAFRALTGTAPLKP